MVPTTRNLTAPPTPPPFVKGIHRLLVNSPDKGLVVLKVSQCQSSWQKTPQYILPSQAIVTISVETGHVITTLKYSEKNQNLANNKLKRYAFKLQTFHNIVYNTNIISDYI